MCPRLVASSQEMRSSLIWKDKIVRPPDWTSIVRQYWPDSLKTFGAQVRKRDEPFGRLNGLEALGPHHFSANQAVVSCLIFTQISLQVIVKGGEEGRKKRKDEKEKRTRKDQKRPEKREADRQAPSNEALIRKLSSPSDWLADRLNQTPFFWNWSTKNASHRNEIVWIEEEKNRHHIRRYYHFGWVNSAVKNCTSRALSDRLAWIVRTAVNRNLLQHWNQISLETFPSWTDNWIQPCNDDQTGRFSSSSLSS